MKNYDSNFKMNPPLRTEQDRDAMLAGLADGTMECIASDHAPHCTYEKEVEFDIAPFGIIGLETELALSLELVRKKVLTLPQLGGEIHGESGAVVAVEERDAVDRRRCGYYRHRPRQAVDIRCRQIGEQVPQLPVQWLEFAGQGRDDDRRREDRVAR